MDAANLLRAAQGGLPVDPLTFLKRPQVALRVVGILFALIILGCVSVCHEKACVYCGHASTCSFAKAMSFLAFLGLLAFVVVEAMFDRVSNVKMRRHILLAELGYSGLWAFLLFVTFCMMAHSWANCEPEFVRQVTNCVNNARSGLLFCFLSIPLFGVLTFFSLQRFRLGGDGSAGFNDLQPDAHMHEQQGDGTAAPYTGAYTDPQAQQYGQAFGDQPGAANQQYYTPTY